MSTENNLNSMVDERRIRSTVKRLFTNDPREVLGELLQNSQRAGAKTVHFTYETNKEQGTTLFEYHDDGHGLKGLEGFHKLLRIADSGFLPEVELNQEPMGLGFQSLLAIEDLHSVEIISGELRLHINPHSWWTQPEYYETWFTRIAHEASTADGRQIDKGFYVSFLVGCVIDEDKLVKGGAVYGTNVAENLVIEMLPESEEGEHRTTQGAGYFNQYKPCVGYADLLQVYTNGLAVNTSVPKHFTENVFVKTKWQGNDLYIRTPLGYGYFRSLVSYVNWYGQIIEMSSNKVNPAFYLHVREGRPVTLLAPSRKKIVIDSKLLDLQEFVKDQLFAAIAKYNTNTNEKGFITDLTFLGALLQAYQTDSKRAENSLDYLIIADVNEISKGDLYDDVCDMSAINYAMRYDAIPENAFFLDEVFADPNSIRISEKDKKGNNNEINSNYSDVAGLQIVTSVRECRYELYTLIYGNRDRLEAQEKAVDIVWKPGTKQLNIYDIHFYELGRWAFCKLTEDYTAYTLRSSWMPVIEPVTFINEEDQSEISSMADVTQGKWHIGCASPLDSIDYFSNVFSYSAGGENDVESQWEAFQETLQELKEKIVGDALSRDEMFSSSLHRRVTNMLAEAMQAEHGEDTSFCYAITSIEYPIENKDWGLLYKSTSPRCISYSHTDKLIVHVQYSTEAMSEDKKETTLEITII